MRNQVIRGRENYAKDAIKFYYKLAKINGLTNELLEVAGLKSEDSLRWSYNNGRISVAQVNAYNYILGVEKKYLVGEEELTEELKAIEMERLKKQNKSKNYNMNDQNQIKEGKEATRVSDIIIFYKDKIINCKNNNSRNEIKQELEIFRKEINKNIEHLVTLIETMNIINEKSEE